MFTHIVLFKLKDKSQETIQKIKKDLLELKEKIPLIKFMEVGIDVVHSERSYDIALYTKFDSLEDMKAYQAHPDHVKFSQYVSTVRESSVSLDY